MSKKLSPYSAAVVHLKVHRREEDYRVVLQEEDFPEQNSMLTRRVGNITAFYMARDCDPAGLLLPLERILHTKRSLRSLNDYVRPATVYSRASRYLCPVV